MSVFSVLSGSASHPSNSFLFPFKLGPLACLSCFQTVVHALRHVRTSTHTRWLQAPPSARPAWVRAQERGCPRSNCRRFQVRLSTDCRPERKGMCLIQQKKKKVKGNGFPGFNEDLSRLHQHSADGRLSNETDACLAAGSPFPLTLEPSQNSAR